jgi:predicted dehydrogenase
VRDVLREGAIGRLISGHALWSSGRVGSVGTHYFDAINMLVDDQVAWVSGRLDPASQPQPQWPDILDPGGMATLVYQNGARITVDAMENTHSSFDVYLFGTKGQLHFLRDGREVQYWAFDEEVPARTRYSPSPPVPARAPPVTAAGPGPEDWQAGLQDLLSCIGQQRQPESTGGHGRHALEVIVALHESSRQSMQPIHLPLTGDAVQRDLRFR